MRFQKQVILLAFAIPFVHADDLANTNLVANNVANSGQAIRVKASKQQDVSTAWKAAWWGSLAFHGAGTAFDSYTSYHQGPYESSALLRDSDGQFGNKAIVIKTVTFGGLAAAQWLIVRKWPKMTKLFIPFNTFLGITYVHDGIHNQAFLAAQH